MEIDEVGLTPVTKDGGEMIPEKNPRTVLALSRETEPTERTERDSLQGVGSRRHGDENLTVCSWRAEAQEALVVRSSPSPKAWKPGESTVSSCWKSWQAQSQEESMFPSSLRPEKTSAPTLAVTQEEFPHSAFLFCSGLQLNTLGRAICFT